MFLVGHGSDLNWSIGGIEIEHYVLFLELRGEIGKGVLLVLVNLFLTLYMYEV